MRDSLVGRVIWLLSGRSFSDAIQFLFYVSLVRRFGEEGIGDYAFAFALAALLAMGVGYGLRAYVTRELVQEPALGRTLPASLMALQGLLIVVVVAVFLLLVHLLPIRGPALTICWLAFVATLLNFIAYTFLAMIEAAGAMHRSAQAEAGSKLLIVLVGCSLLYRDVPLSGIVFAHLSGGLLFVALSFYWARAAYGPFSWLPQSGLIRRVLVGAMPFALGDALYLIYSRVDILMLHQIQDAASAGAYSVASRSIETGMAVAGMVGLAIYPALALSESNDRATRDRVFRDSLRWLALVGGAGALLLAIAGEPLARLVFGEEMGRSGALLRLMGLLLLIGFVKVPLYRLLFAERLEWLQIRFQTGCMLANVLLNAALIPFWGAYGAAWASILSESLLLILFYRRCSKISPSRYARWAAAFFVALTAALAIGLGLERVASWWIAAAGAGVAFAAFGAGLKLIRRSDWHSVLRLAGR